MNERRTQAERSAETIAVLITATLATLEDVGYSRTTTEEICRRAGVSQGALFHHFDTRVDLISAAIQRHEAGLLRILERAIADVDEHGWSNDDPVWFLENLIERVHHPRNAAFLEALLGSRGDDRLRDDLHRVVDRLFDSMRPLITRHPAFADVAPDRLDRWIHLLRDYLAGDSLWRAVGAGAGPDRDRLEALVDLVRRLPA